MQLIFDTCYVATGKIFGNSIFVLVFYYLKGKLLLQEVYSQIRALRPCPLLARYSMDFLLLKLKSYHIYASKFIWVIWNKIWYLSCRSWYTQLLLKTMLRKKRTSRRDFNRHYQSLCTILFYHIISLFHKQRWSFCPASIYFPST